MDPDVKKHLDLRLAKGEISRQDYLSTLQTLTQGSGRANHSPLSLLSKAKDALFAEYQMVTPSDESPLVVDQYLCLRGQSLVYMHNQLPYSQILSLAYTARKEYINAVRTAYEAELTILWQGGQATARASAGSWMLGKLAEKKIKLAENAYLFLSRITFMQRLALRLSDFERQGYTTLDTQGEVHLYPNGDVQKGNLRLNLRTSHRIGAFRIGRAGLFSVSPDEVVIGESGTSFLSRRIITGLFYDKDVKRFLLLGLAEHGTLQ